MAKASSKVKGEGAARRISPLLFAWTATALVFGAIALWSELTYEPATAEADRGEPSQTTAAETGDTAEGDTDSVQGPSESAQADEAEDDDAEGGTLSQQSTEPSQSPGNGGDAAEQQDGSGSGAAVQQANAPSRQTLHPAPDGDLTEEGPEGPIPIVSDDGRQVWQVYARPFAADPDRPRIAIVLTGMGLSEGMTASAIESLPGAVTFAFSPYAAALQERVDAARREGHEALLMVPMEPMDYPENDPGPLTLLVDAADRANLDRLRRALGRFSGYVGIINHMGSRFTASADAITPIVEELAGRGVMIVDARSTRFTVASRLAREAGAPVAFNNRYIDNDASAAEVRRQLQELENIAETIGSAVGIGRPYPVTLREVARWAAGLEDKSLVLAPITALANRQPQR